MVKQPIEGVSRKERKETKGAGKEARGRLEKKKKKNQK